MARYYDTRDSKIKVLNIPKELLPKKPFLLPVELNKVRIQDTEKTKEVEGIKVLKDKVIWTTIEVYHVDTLEETKEKQIQALKSYVQPKFPKEYVQRNASLGVYSKEKNLEIINEVKKWDKYVNDFKQKINDSKEGIVEFRTKEDIANAKLEEELMGL